ncbi:hypothetical protein PHJA_002834100 [Phtheirospermum japonicum]|uniref:Uncharacterized protein n=1 Tax=Phtheirospermum japonicum TaxID=374723 RepID=A0A830D4A8_9LAMI|nr:hypothetical protein PHJA_002834100 [Phtheirospermum japonicum]
MASNNRVSAVFLIALLFAASYPLAHGRWATLRGLRVDGRLCCTSTGNCPVLGGQGVAGVPVSLNCTITGASFTAGQGTTSANGAFDIFTTVPTLLKHLQSSLFKPPPIIPCVATARLPLDSAVICPVLSAVNDTLVSNIQNVGETFSTNTGLIRTATITEFVRLGM